MQVVKSPKLCRVSHDSTWTFREKFSYEPRRHVINHSNKLSCWDCRQDIDRGWLLICARKEVSLISSSPRERSFKVDCELKALSSDQVPRSCQVSNCNLSSNLKSSRIFGAERCESVGESAVRTVVLDCQACATENMGLYEYPQRIERHHFFLIKRSTNSCPANRPTHFTSSYRGGQQPLIRRNCATWLEFTLVAFSFIR